MASHKPDILQVQTNPAEQLPGPILPVTSPASARFVVVRDEEVGRDARLILRYEQIIEAGVFLSDALGSSATWKVQTMDWSAPLRVRSA